MKAAFLQGYSIERDLYLKPPKEAGTLNLWKLKKTVYGLCDAPRSWYLNTISEPCDFYEKNRIKIKYSISFLLVMASDYSNDEEE